MADLLTHVLVAYVLLTVSSWVVGWLTRRWVVVGMGGAAIPDLVKIDIVLDDATVSRTIGVPISYDPISSLFGIVVISAAIAVHFGTNRRRVYVLLLTGGLASLVVDGLRAFAGGRGGFWLYPIWWRPPTPSLYVSSDHRVLLLAVFTTAVVYGVDRWFGRDGSDSSTGGSRPGYR